MRTPKELTPDSAANAAVLPTDDPKSVTSTQSHPPPEDEFGGGDVCSPEKDPPTDDDVPLV